MLIDNHGRTINYLRLAVTDNCNLRCQYCMPEEGVQFAHKKELLSWDELWLLSQTFVAMGVDKIRITGGEPFVRKGLMDFLEKLSGLEGLEEISITTNATLIGPHILHLKQLGITKINISFDSLDKARFNEITRRDQYDTVMANIQRMMEEGFDVKLNCVIMDGKNTEDIIPFVKYVQDHPISVRFLEEMPFNGQTSEPVSLKWDYIAILEHIKEHFGPIQKLPAPASSTSLNYQREGSKGTFGVIPSYSRTFCGTCNRVRVTAKGEMQTCLYSTETIDLRALLRESNHINGLKFSIFTAMQARHKDGFEAENQSETKKSMTLIGG
ncbi:GTP 3',8-cyclase MoaA [Echinicola vietnamensis]|uniref:GTP 3',8-cyclase n=1 Tax=Echinicola vietnamensis (strain DSM 17526 / LMG 23754 / KMM 6221) TaxID=926556 RepID=L0FW73_ECHVK|nr:GTP 3',8-cyclase MoaA [Echinicola vietnamensis]AGA78149.1 molybdenum cofactor biosynthesis protein A [Echinicola vietnamensis DSM 17526]